MPFLGGDIEDAKYHTYNVIINAVNMRTEDVVFLWTLNGQGYITKVGASSNLTIHLVIPSKQELRPLRFVANTATSQTVVKINGQDSLQIQPKLIKKPVFVYIDKEGKNAHTSISNLHLFLVD